MDKIPPNSTRSAYSLILGSLLRRPEILLASGLVLLITCVLGIRNTNIQLLPDIDRPSLTVETSWRAVLPQEIEERIVKPQERALANLPGLAEIRSRASVGIGTLQLTFDLDTDMNAATADVIGRINGIEDLPENSSVPRIERAFGANSRQIGISLVYLTSSARSEHELSQIASRVVIPKFMAIRGVDHVVEVTPITPQLVIEVDPYKSAAANVDFSQLGNALSQPANQSAGFFNEQNKEYAVRYAGSISPENITEWIVGTSVNSPIYLRDIATVSLKDLDRKSFAKVNGTPAIALRITQSKDANLLAVMDQINSLIDELNVSVLLRDEVTLVRTQDVSSYIRTSLVSLLIGLGFGALLSAGVVYYVFRSIPITSIVLLTVPIAVIVSVMTINATGKSINIVSLAGIAFAVGIVLDACIVMVDSILASAAKNRNSMSSTVNGGSRVVVAIAASTITTVGVFFPLVFAREPSTQLFADLGLMISVSVIVSALLAYFVAPVALYYLLRIDEKQLQQQKTFDWNITARKIVGIGNSQLRRWSIGTIIPVVTVILSFLIVPDFDYLPPLKRNTVDAFITIPTGVSMQYAEQELAGTWIPKFDKLLSESAQLSASHHVIVFFSPYAGIVSIRPTDESNSEELLELLRTEIQPTLPGMEVFPYRANVLTVSDDGRSIAVNLHGTRTEDLERAAKLCLEIIPTLIEGAFATVDPPLNQGQPLYLFQPNDTVINEAGWTRADLGRLIGGLFRGNKVGEYFDGTDSFDVILKFKDVDDIDTAIKIPMYSPSARLYTLEELSNVQLTDAPSEIDRINGERSVTIWVQVPDGWTIAHAQQAIAPTIETIVSDIAQEAIQISYSGSAGELNSALDNMANYLGFAMLLLFLLLYIIFRSVKDSVVILVSVPLSMIGGVIAIRIANDIWDQTLDVLAIVGFLILFGLVVNNSILLVQQFRLELNNSHSVEDALISALTSRLRPIILTVATTVVSILPLLLIFSAGGNVYRSLAIVLIGGMLGSTFLSLGVTPCLLRLTNR